MAIDLSKFRPNLAAQTDDYDWSKLKYPVYVSPKIDGIRCVCHPTMGAVSRSLKPIPNKHIREVLSLPDFRWLDGEIVVGKANAPDVFNRSQSGVMSEGGTPEWTYLVFDHIEAGNMCGFGIRHEDARRQIQLHQLSTTVWPNVRLIPHELVETFDMLLMLEERYIAQGYEGLMIRSPGGKYKFGRSTQREQGLLKMKRFMDGEARIVGWEPLLRNMNEAKIDALGLQKRGYSQDGKVADITLAGKVNVVGVSGQWVDISFDVGSGLDDTLRRDIAANFESKYLNKTLTYKYQPHGSLEAPRTPIWKGIRHD